MKLLLDQNLSPRLCGALRDLWPEIIHVGDVGLQAVEDLVVWEYAAKHGLAIVSKDSDFNSLSFLFGAPPKVIWIQLGNCSTRDVELVLRAQYGDVLAFNDDPDASLLVLGPQSHS